MKVIEGSDYSVDCTVLERVVLNRGAFYGRESNATNSLRMTGPNENGVSSRFGSLALVGREGGQLRPFGFPPRHEFAFEQRSTVDIPSLSSLAFDTSNCFAETSYAVVVGTRGRQVSVVRVLSVLSIPYSIQPDWKPIYGSDDG